MKVLEDTRAKLQRELPHCKTQHDLEQLLNEARTMLIDSHAPHGQKQLMWEQIKENLSNYLRRPDLINDAHSIIDRILKNTYSPFEVT